MDDTIDLSMSFDNDDDRPSSPHNTKETAIVIDGSSSDSDTNFLNCHDEDEKEAQKMPWPWDTTLPGCTSPPATNKTCAACGKGGVNLKKCSGCKSVHYCNASCQYSHWVEHRDECKNLRAADAAKATTTVNREQYATSTARVSLSPTMNHNPSYATATCYNSVAFGNSLTVHRYGCSICPETFPTIRMKNRHQKKCRKRQMKKVKPEHRRNSLGGDFVAGKVKAEKQVKAKEKEVGEDVVEEADEITYTSYKPQKIIFGHDHPDPVVENSTLSAVEPPDVEYNLAMPADILSRGLLSNVQLEAIVYGCMRHLIDLPVKEKADFFDRDDAFCEKNVTVEKPLRAGFLLGDGAGELLLVM